MIVAACDDGWDDLGTQYCAKFVFQLNTWDEARAYCSFSGAFLVDVLSADMEFYLNCKRRSCSLLSASILRSVCN